MSNEITDDYGVGTAGSGGGRTNAFNFEKLGREVKFLKPKEAGALVFDIIQRKDNQVGILYRVHRNMGANRQHDIICPAQFGGQCPICDMQKKMANDLEAQGVAKPWSTKEVKALFPKDRIVYNVKNPNNHDEPMMLLDASEFKVLKKVSAAAATHKQINALQRFPYASPTEGSTVVATITMEEMTTGNKTIKFADWSGFSFMDRKAQYPASVLDEVIEIEKYLNVLDYTSIEKILYGIVDTAPEEFVDDMPDDAPVAPAPAPKAAEEKPATVGVQTPASVNVQTVKETKAEELKCAFGGRFGKDFNQLDECAEECQLFLECRRANRSVTSL